MRRERALAFQNTYKPTTLKAQPSKCEPEPQSSNLISLPASPFHTIPTAVLTIPTAKHDPHRYVRTEGQQDQRFEFYSPPPTSAAQRSVRVLDRMIPDCLYSLFRCNPPPRGSARTHTNIHTHILSVHPRTASPAHSDYPPALRPSPPPRYLSARVFSVGWRGGGGSPSPYLE